MFTGQEERLAIDGRAPVRTAPWPTYDKGDVFISPEDEQAAIKALRRKLYFRYDYRPTGRPSPAAWSCSSPSTSGCRTSSPREHVEAIRDVCALRRHATPRSSR
jgi:hypothetical protein